MSRWRIENYWMIRALRDNTTRVMYRHRVKEWGVPRPLSELELRWLYGDH